MIRSHVLLKSAAAAGLLATTALAADYIEVLSRTQLQNGDANLTTNTTTIVHEGAAYTHLAKTSTPRDFAIQKTTNLGGTPSVTTLANLASWTAGIGVPSNQRIFTGNGMGIAGDYIQIPDTENAQVYRVHKDTGEVSVYISNLAIRNTTGQATAGVTNWSGISPTGEVVFFENISSSILLSTGADSLTTLVSSTDLQAAQGNSLIHSGLTFDNSGNLYWGNNTTMGLYKRASDGTISEIIPGSALTAILGAGTHNYSGDVFYAPNGLIYFRFGSTATQSIFSFDPAAANPADTLVQVLNRQQLVDGPAGTSALGPFSWYNGNLAWSVFQGGLYAIPEPGTLSLLALGSLALLRRRK